jgi:hypothetical protein
MSIYTLEYFEGFREKFILFEDYLDKLLHIAQKNDKSGLLSTLGAGLSKLLGGVAGLGVKLLGGLKHFAFGKWGNMAAGGAGLLAGGLSVYKNLAPSKEKYGEGLGTANAIARGMITGAFTAIGTKFGGAAGGALMGFLGEMLGEQLNKFGEWLGGALFDLKVGEKIEAIFTSIGTTFSGVGTWATGVFTSISTVFSDAGSFISTTFSGIGSSIGTVFSDAGSFISTKFDDIGIGISDIFTSIGTTFTDITTWIKSIFTTVGDIFGSSVAFIKETFSSFIPSGSDIVGVLKSIFSTILGLDTAGKAYDAAKDMVGGFFGGEEKRTTEPPTLSNQFNTAAKGYKEETRTVVPTATPASADEMARSGVFTIGQAPASVPSAADGAFINKGGIIQVHPAEIASPVSKLTDMVSRTTTSTTQPAAASSPMMDGKVLEYLAAIVSGIKELVNNKGQTAVDGGNKYNPSIPDFPGDPGVIFGGNYFPQKGSQWG